MSDPKRVRVVIRGRVQGVFFRVTCAREARSRGLGGAVRNSPDGSVEAFFEGPANEVDAMVDWCRTGPELAEISSVEVIEEPPAGEGSFTISG
jgi:acylphosphatase